METWERGDDLAELLRVVRRQGAPGEVLRWLGRRTGADVAWVGCGGAVEAATPEFPEGLAGALREQLERLADGRLAAATTHVDGLEVRLEAFGGREPRPVLVTVSASELSRDAAVLASQAGALLELLGKGAGSRRHLARVRAEGTATAIRGADRPAGRRRHDGQADDHR